MKFDKPLNIHLELTTHCNSKCLDCNRYIRGTDILNPNIDLGKKGLISLDAIDNLIVDSNMINSIILTGTYGDAPWHPKFFDIIEKFPDNIKFGMETNGGMKNAKFWNDLGNIINKKFNSESYVTFGIDGPNNEIHQLYRRGVDYDKVIDNARTLRSTGVRVNWSFIEFDFNEKYVDVVEQQAKLFDFKFKKRRSRLRHRKNNDKYLSTKQKKILNEFKDNGIKKISCEWYNKQQLNIDYTSRVWMCCYFSSYYHYWPTNVDDNDTSYNRRVKENLQYYLDQYSNDWNLLSHHTLKDILTHKFFVNDLNKSFNNQDDFPTIQRCLKHCNNCVSLLDEKLRV